MKKSLFSFFMLLMIVFVSAGNAFAAASFTDVGEDRYYYEAVEWAVSAGITQGVSANTFAPNGSCTRGQCVTFLYRYAGSPEVTGESYKQFSDVKEGKYYTKAVSWAVDTGITSGTSATTFSPDAPCTRAQIVTFLYRYAGEEASEAVVSFSDVDPSSYYGPAVAWAVESEITNGATDTTFNPGGTCIRAQIVTFLYRLDQAVGRVMSGSGSSVDVYSVTSLAIDENDETAAAIVSAPENCALLVRFIEEELYFSEDFEENREYIWGGDLYGSHVVGAGTDMEEVLCDIYDYGGLPEYFVAEAVLVDNNGEALCEPYTSIEHTSRYEQFSQETAADFPDATLVLNFDESLTNNFGVLADDVKVIEASALSQDEESGVYTITGTSENLNPGDKVFVSDAEGEALFRVASLTKEGNVLKVVAARADDSVYGYALEDFYQFLKVDMNVEIDEDGVVRTSPEEDGDPLVGSYPPLVGGGINVKNVYHDVSGSVSLDCNPITFETTHFEIVGKVGGKVSADVVIQWDVVLFGKDYFRCDLETKSELNASLNINGKWGTENNKELEKLLKSREEKKELKLGKFRIPFGVTGFDAFAEVKANIQWKATAGVEIKGNVEETGGFKYNTKDGYQKIEKKKTDWSVNAKGYAEVAFGPQPEIGVEFLGGVVSAGVDCFLGMKASAEALVPVAQGGDARHGCNLCIDGEVNGVVEVSAKLKYKITDFLKGTPIDLTIVDIEWKLFDFYLSLINEKTSMFGGHMHAGTGSCPNQEFKVTLIANDENDNKVNAIIEILNQADRKMLTTVASGGSVYLSPATYIAKATIKGTVSEKTFTVSSTAKTITIAHNSADAKINGNVRDASSKDPIEGAKVEVYDYTTLIGSTETDADGNYQMAVPEGSFHLRISADGHISTRQYFSIKNGENKYLSAMLMVGSDSEHLMGGVYGNITDAITGESLENVSIRITEGWGNEDITMTYARTAETDEWGDYDLRKYSVFGVDFGLNAGNYTVNISKDGYISTSFNITVVGGEDLEFNSVLTPVGAEDIYRVVLTWGAEPEDLDSHLNAVYEIEDESADSSTPSLAREHIYYHEQTGQNGYLDVDDTSSYGPETITVRDIKKYSGKVYYSVHDYSHREETDSKAMSLSGAVVKVYKGSDLIETYAVPTGVGGTVWNVFYLDENEELHTQNTFEYISEPGDVANELFTANPDLQNVLVGSGAPKPESAAGEAAAEEPPADSVVDEVVTEDDDTEAAVTEDDDTEAAVTENGDAEASVVQEREPDAEAFAEDRMQGKPYTGDHWNETVTIEERLRDSAA